MPASVPATRCRACRIARGTASAWTVTSGRTSCAATRPPLAPGMCFSDEPMIAIYGEFGIRLRRLPLHHRERPEVLHHAEPRHRHAVRLTTPEASGPRSSRDGCGTPIPAANARSARAPPEALCLGTSPVGTWLPARAAEVTHALSPPVPLRSPRAPCWPCRAFRSAADPHTDSSRQSTDGTCRSWFRSLVTCRCSSSCGTAPPHGPATACHVSPFTSHPAAPSGASRAIRTSGSARDTWTETCGSMATCLS